MAARGKTSVLYRRINLRYLLMNNVLERRNHLLTLNRKFCIVTEHFGRNLGFFRGHVLRRFPCVEVRSVDLSISRNFSLKSTDGNFDNDGEEYPETEDVLERLRRSSHGVISEDQKVFVIQPNFKWVRNRQHIASIEHRLEEACGLVESIQNWKVCQSSIEPVRKIDSKHFFGKGKVQTLDEIIKSKIESSSITAVFIDVERLTAKQVKELESLWGIQVFDRFGIVLQIFKERAHTAEAKLQVELAEIPYLRSRLAHDADPGSFDQQRGGTHSMSGSGETQLQLERRVLQAREVKLKKKLEKVRRNRAFLRADRQKKHLPIVSVVGYTNAGKTTLVKKLTGELEMKPENKLFATLDVTHHGGQLPGGMPVLYVDTVGFVSELPVELVECFAATLEDVVNSDMLIHVRDVNHPETMAQKVEVLQVLRRLNVPKTLLDNMIEVHNKIDLREEPFIENDIEMFKTIQVSSIDGTGFDQLVPTIEEGVMAATKKYFKTLIIPVGGPHLSWLHHETTVHDVEARDDGSLAVSVVMDSAILGKYLARFEHIKTKRNKVKNKNHKNH